MPGHRRPVGGPWRRAFSSVGLLGLLLGSAACGGDGGGSGRDQACAVTDASDQGEPGGR